MDAIRPVAVRETYLRRVSTEPVLAVARVAGLPVDVALVELEVEVALTCVGTVNDNELEQVPFVLVVGEVADAVPRHAERGVTVEIAAAISDDVIVRVGAIRAGVHVGEEGGEHRRDIVAARQALRRVDAIRRAKGDVAVVVDVD